jgi:hypothetical protein
MIARRIFLKSASAAAISARLSEAQQALNSSGREAAVPQPAGPSHPVFSVIRRLMEILPESEQLAAPKRDEQARRRIPVRSADQMGAGRGDAKAYPGRESGGVVRVPESVKRCGSIDVFRLTDGSKVTRQAITKHPRIKRNHSVARAAPGREHPKRLLRKFLSAGVSIRASAVRLSGERRKQHVNGNIERPDFERRG